MVDGNNTLIAYHLKAKYLDKIKNSKTVEEAKLYFEKAVDESAMNTIKQLRTEAMENSLNRVNQMDYLPDIVKYSEKLIEKFKHKL